MSELQASGARSLWQIFRWPIALGISGVLGLTAALAGDGGYDVLSWLTLGALPATVGVCWRRSSHAHSR